MTDDRSDNTTGPDGESQNQCPICGEPVDAEDEYFPFCSKRCRMIDLGRWLGGDYRITRPIEQRDLEEE